MSDGAMCFYCRRYRCICEEDEVTPPKPLESPQWATGTSCEVFIPVGGPGISWERPAPGTRPDIVGVRHLDDGSTEYLMHNNALCNPYYVGTSPDVEPKPIAPQAVQRWRKKPVVIEALRYDGKNHDAIKRFTEGRCYRDVNDPNHPLFMIRTLEGEHVASEGDYIIKGVKGEFYPCKPDIFAQTYELESAQPKAEKVEKLVEDAVLADIVKNASSSQYLYYQLAKELQQYRQREKRGGE
jgi:hypothetical protein